MESEKLSFSPPPPTEPAPQLPPPVPAVSKNKHLQLPVYQFTD